MNVQFLSKLLQMARVFSSRENVFLWYDLRRSDHGNCRLMVNFCESESTTCLQHQIWRLELRALLSVTQIQSYVRVIDFWRTSSALCQKAV